MPDGIQNQNPSGQDQSGGSPAKSNMVERRSSDAALRETREEIFKFFHRFVVDNNTPSKKERLYPYAFEIDEFFIDKVDRRVRESFSSLQAWSPKGTDQVTFKAEVGFADL